MNYVQELLREGERAKVQAVNLHQASVNFSDWPNVLIYFKKYRERDFKQARELCYDALERQSTITEKLDGKD